MHQIEIVILFNSISESAHPYVQHGSLPSLARFVYLNPEMGHARHAANVSETIADEKRTRWEERGTS